MANSYSMYYNRQTDTVIILRENLFFLLLLKKSCEIIISDLKQIKRIIIFCIDYAKTVKQIDFFLFLRGGRGGGKKKVLI